MDEAVVGWRCAVVGSSSGWALMASDSSASLFPEGATEDIAFTGSGGTAGGIYIRGDPAGVISSSSSYGDHQNFNRVRVTGFGGPGVQWGNNAWSDTIFESLIAFNGTGVYFPASLTNSGERLSVIFLTPSEESNMRPSFRRRGRQEVYR